MVFDAEYHRKRIRELTQEPPDEPTHCELKRELSYESKQEKAELVKDVAAFANAPLEHHGGFGYLIFGVTGDGSIRGVPNPLPGDPSSEIRNLLSRYLERPVGFEFVTVRVEDGGQARLLAAIVVPNSRRKPHVISRELQEQQDKKTKFFLREGEVWVRKAGGRQLATAEDVDAMYEAKLLSVVRDAAEPLRQRIEVLERELDTLRSATPALSFGVASYDGARGEVYPVPEAEALSATEMLFTEKELSEVMQRRALADEQSKRRSSGFHSYSIGADPSPQEYERYVEELNRWLKFIGSFVLVELAVDNTGEAVAENVEISLKPPGGLKFLTELPDEPSFPQSSFARLSNIRRASASIPPLGTDDEIQGPYFNEHRMIVSWEVGKLYHGRPLATESTLEYLSGLMLEREEFERIAASNSGKVEVPYTIRAANLRRPVEGVLRLLPSSAEE